MGQSLRGLLLFYPLQAAGTGPQAARRVAAGKRASPVSAVRSTAGPPPGPAALPLHKLSPPCTLPADVLSSKQK